MASIVWSMSARDDLISIRSYIARDNKIAARAVARHIISIAHILAAHPEIGTRTRFASVRRLVVRSSPYVIYYRIVGAELEILKIFDVRRDLPRTEPD